jgi:hypothetical protein
MSLPILYFYQIIQKLIKITTGKTEITFVGRYYTVLTLAAEAKHSLKSSSILDGSRSEVVITTIPSYAELFKSVTIFRAHGNLELDQQLFSQGLKSI